MLHIAGAGRLDGDQRTARNRYRSDPGVGEDHLAAHQGFAARARGSPAMPGWPAAAASRGVLAPAPVRCHRRADEPAAWPGRVPTGRRRRARPPCQRSRAGPRGSSAAPGRCDRQSVVRPPPAPCAVPRSRAHPGARAHAFSGRPWSAWPGDARRTGLRPEVRTPGDDDHRERFEAVAVIANSLRRMQLRHAIDSIATTGPRWRCTA